MADEERWEVRIRQSMSIGAAALGGAFTAAFLVLTILGVIHGFWASNTLTHIPTIIGLPFAALASLLLVLVLRTVAGNIELKALGIEFKGAAGPIIMWILCFLAITLAIAKTWGLTQPIDSSRPAAGTVLEAPKH